MINFSVIMLKLWKIVEHFFSLIFKGIDLAKQFKPPLLT